MGKLIDGKWCKGDIVNCDKKGAYDRLPRTFRELISKDHPQFKPESKRYHLYVSFACPWATRTLIYRELKDLSEHISVSVVHPDMLTEGWVFDSSFPGATEDHLFQSHFLREIYLRADQKISTSVTVPVLWDKMSNTIVNNESSEIIRMFNDSFNDLTGNQLDFYPEHLRSEIDTWNDKIYPSINNGVYRTGFAKTQEAYDEAITLLFDQLDEIESILSEKTFLTGDQITEADLRLIPTLLRFDIVYVTHFKCNIRRLIDYPQISRYVKELCKIPAIKNTHHFDHIKRHYYYSHDMINPYRIIPKGPAEVF